MYAEARERNFCLQSGVCINMSSFHSSAVLSFRMCVSACRLLMERGAFVVQLLRWWESRAPAACSALPPPPPPQARVSHTHTHTHTHNQNTPIIRHFQREFMLLCLFVCSLINQKLCI